VRFPIKWHLRPRGRPRSPPILFPSWQAGPLGDAPLAWRSHARHSFATGFRTKQLPRRGIPSGLGKKEGHVAYAATTQSGR
jgi:hypothetical protein